MALNKTINNIKTAVEMTDANAFVCMNYISVNYEDELGYNYSTLKHRIESFFKDVKNIKIKILKKEKKFNKTFLPDECSVNLHIIIEAALQEISNTMGQEYISLDFGKEDSGSWVVIKFSRMER